MAFPKLLQKLFQNNGAGDKLNQDIIPDIPYSKIPDIPYSKITDAPVVDSALSSTSENPVQNKVINSALDGKLSTSGGTVNGSIAVKDGLVRRAGQKNFYIYGDDNDGCLQLISWDTADFNSKRSASLLLTTPGYTGAVIPAGSFYLTAMDATTGAKSLSGSPNGSLRWCGKNVLTGNSAGLTVVAESYSPNSWYRKYSDGWIEQGGLFTGTAKRKAPKATLTFPVAFSATPVIVTLDMVAQPGVRTGRLSLKYSHEDENPGFSYTATGVIEAASTGVSLRLTSNNLFDTISATFYYVVVGK